MKDLYDIVNHLYSYACEYNTIQGGYAMALGPRNIHVAETIARLQSTISTLPWPIMTAMVGLAEYKFQSLLRRYHSSQTLLSAEEHEQTLAQTQDAKMEILGGVKNIVHFMFKLESCPEDLQNETCPLKTILEGYALYVLMKSPFQCLNSLMQ
jgi:hypothetical protein